MKKIIMILAAFLIILSFHSSEKLLSVEKFSENGLSLAHRIRNNSFQVYQDSTWNEITIKGVNIGMTRPGFWPGEVAITYEEYYRWFEMIAKMNANTIRIYTIHPPAFYEALYDYNLYHKTKLYLLQGVWADEEPLIKNLDAFHEETYQPFQNEITRIIDLLHGNAVLPERPGHAHGIYTKDVSPYVSGFIIGIEWLPEMVENTNKVHQDKTTFTGEFFETKNASPFEVFLAEMMDFTRSYEASTYEEIRPISFTNWVSTDLLTHPYEPDISEDLVSVNPNHIISKSHDSYFASYHVYPYYPDFLNLDPKYTEYLDESGEPNNYEGYLNDLIKNHDMPVLIAEFGIPSSRGMTHKNVQGWNQGFIEEQEQGKIVSRLFESIINQNYLGGLIFSWQDEWFKRTWNTMDLDNEDRRAFWSNAQTNEQQFGLLSFDRHKIQIDGNLSEWKSAEMVDYMIEDPTVIKKVQIDYDERYLYLSFQKNGEINEDHFFILLNTIKNQGNKKHPSLPYQTKEGMEYLIEIRDQGESRIWVDKAYDFHDFLYREKLKLKQSSTNSSTSTSGNYSKIYLALNRGFTIPETGEVFPFEDYETGRLQEGNGNPESSMYNSLSDYYINHEEGIIELRIPWLLIGFTDPSTKEIMGNFRASGIEARENVQEISFTLIHEKDKSYNAVSPVSDDTILTEHLFKYTWDEWTEPQTKERLKKSYPYIQSIFKKYSN